jgi:hypothetical protein
VGLIPKFKASAADFFGGEGKPNARVGSGNRGEGGGIERGTESIGPESSFIATEIDLIGPEIHPIASPSDFIAPMTDSITPEIEFIAPEVKN